MKKVALIARLLLGLIYFVFGLNGFFQFLKMNPPPMSEAAMAFAGGLMKSGYFMPLASGTQVLGGILLLSGFAAPLGLTILAPMTLNIVLFHVFLTPGLSNLVFPAVMLVFHLLAATAYWDDLPPKNWADCKLSHEVVKHPKRSDLCNGSDIQKSKLWGSLNNGMREPRSRIYVASMV